ncbi:MAG: phosphodiester glycosidase family protein, partial [Clostridiales bacterium]|nr:phosphodiester glycosidase family protein [Clostridiales bacterium]
MKKWIKNTGKAFAAVAVAVSVVFSGNAPAAFAAATYYNASEKLTVTKGLTYEKSRRVTDAGLLDVHVLQMDLNSPHLSIATVKSKTELSLKETTQKLINDNGAVAGINGDFFGISGQYSVPLGVEFAGGELLSVNENSNISGDGNATFFLDKDNNPFISYFRTEVHFLNDGHENVKVGNVNKVFDLG